MMKKIKKAVIPCAGLGTRFLPASKALPKEMIPILDTPMIFYIVEEAVRAGIEDIVLVTARHKEAIENLFDYNYELEDTLMKRGQEKLANVSRDLAEKCNIITIRQKNPMGLGHAVLVSQPVVGNEPFAVLLGDDIIDSRDPCIGQLIKVYEEQGKSVVGVMEVDPSETSKYGIVEGQSIEDKLIRAKRVVEKPKTGETSSRYAIPGRYVLEPKIFEILKKIQPGKIGEIQLTDGLQSLANASELLAYLFEGVRYDAGDRLGYLEATIAFSLKRDEFREPVKKLLKKYLNA